MCGFLSEMRVMQDKKDPENTKNNNGGSFPNSLDKKEKNDRQVTSSSNPQQPNPEPLFGLRLHV
jgi:hypothetical protein